MFQPQQNVLSRMYFSKLSALEKRNIIELGHENQGLVTARFDMYFDGLELKIIELNATIPAMHAYSDIVKSAYVKALLGIDGQPTQANSLELLDSLIQHYEKVGGTKSRPRIAIISRPGDSQLSELQWLQKAWSGCGYETLLGTPEQLELGKDSLTLQGVSIDLIYRHIFASRLPDKSAFAEACLNFQHYRIFNPISAHLEAKSMLAELSRLASSKTLSEMIHMSDAERMAVNKRVLWSRVVSEMKTDLPNEEKNSDLIPWIKANKELLVIKSSLGYGGSGVYLGIHFDRESNQIKLMRLLAKTTSVRWDEFVNFCAQQEQGQWIVQVKASGLQVDNEFIVGSRSVRAPTFVDCSLFASSGIKRKPTGGACRFSSDEIVNIGLGGGVMPFFTESEFSLLTKSLPRKK